MEKGQKHAKITYTLNVNTLSDFIEQTTFCLNTEYFAWNVQDMINEYAYQLKFVLNIHSANLNHLFHDVFFLLFFFHVNLSQILIKDIKIK